jgi:hypothetical protein
VPGVDCLRLPGIEAAVGRQLVEEAVQAEEQKRIAVIAQSSSARGSAVGEIGVSAEPERKPYQVEGARDKRERRHQEDALDEALKNTFPASDPVSVE